MNRFQAQSRKEKNTNILTNFNLYDKDRYTELINKIKNLLTEHSFSSSTIHVGNPNFSDKTIVIVTINKLAYKNYFVELFKIAITADDIICDSLFETIKQRMDKEIFNIEEIPENETNAERVKRLRLKNRPPPTPLPSNCK